MRWQSNIKTVAAVLLVGGALAGCADTERPVVIDTSQFTVTADPLGPYEILTTVRDDREVASVTLYFGRVLSNDAPPDLASREMEEVGADGQYRAEIPGFPVGSQVVYFIEAEDADGNRGRDPETGYFHFSVQPESAGEFP